MRRRRKDEGQSWEDRLQENWENCLVNHGQVRLPGRPAESLMPPPPVSAQELNLSYQDLGDPFQRDNFLRILRRLIRVEKLQLVSDRLTDLSSVRLPRSEPNTHNAPQQQQQSHSAQLRGQGSPLVLLNICPTGLRLLTSVSSDGSSQTSASVGPPSGRSSACDASLVSF